MRPNGRKLDTATNYEVSYLLTGKLPPVGARWRVGARLAVSAADGAG